MAKPLRLDWRGFSDARRYFAFCGGLVLSIKHSPHEEKWFWRISDGDFSELGPGGLLVWSAKSEAERLLEQRLVEMLKELKGGP